MKAGNPDVDVRNHARTIPGVPIVYVKKSIMELEQPSFATERAIKGIEKEKFKDGVGGAARGVKRGREDDDSDEDGDRSGGPKIRGLQKAKGPNPLSVKKKKPKMGKTKFKREEQDQAQSQDRLQKQKRHRGKRGKGGGHVEGATNGAKHGPVEQDSS